MRQCPACGRAEWEPFFSSPTDRIMTGDQRIGPGRLAKVICAGCGVVANSDRFTAADLEVLYGDAYELNTLGREEHQFFTPAGPVARSQVLADWLAPHLPPDAGRLVEIGCGEGNLLARLGARFPAMEMLGLDGSRRAVELAVAKGLDVRQQLLLGEAPVADADVYLLVNVIEHIEDIPALVDRLKRRLRVHGRIIFCLPVQDYGGYDIFFAEHVWHFTADHFAHVAERCGLRILAADAAHPVNHGIGLFVCEIAADAREIRGHRPGSYNEMQWAHLRHWQEMFRRADAWLAANVGRTLAVFGGGEVFTLFYAFTSLGEHRLAACIDDTRPDGSTKHGIPVHSAEWLATHKVDALLLAVNRKYYDMVIEKVRPYGLTVYPLSM